MRALVAWVGLCVVVLSGCDAQAGAPARRMLREKHAVEVRALVAEDVRRHLRGIEAAGARIAPGFTVAAEPDARASQMRTALRLLTKPPRGIPELIVSARTFTAAIAPSGIVLATDAKAESDRMTGVDLGKQFAVVRAALAGATGHAIDQFPGIEGGEGSVSLLFAAPAQKDGAVVGAALTGMPLWRLAQRLTKQLQLDHVDERGAILWAYLVRDEKLYHFGTPPDLDGALPKAAERRAGLARSPGGFTGEFLQFGRWYAYAVVPLRALGPNIHALLVRSDPE